jgi:hypothetical protein
MPNRTSPALRWSIIAVHKTEQKGGGLAGWHQRQNSDNIKKFVKTSFFEVMPEIQKHLEGVSEGKIFCIIRYIKFYREFDQSWRGYL